MEHIKNLDTKSNASKLPDELIINGEKSNDPTVIIGKLNCFFSSISEKLKSEQTENGPEFDWGEFKSHVNSKVPDNVQFKIPKLTLENLITSIRSLDPSKAAGLDGITPKIIKLSAEVIDPTLLRIINTSISTGHFPDNLKIAKILPIHKGGAKGDRSNYRPISILSVFSKLIEKHVTKHLFGYLNKYDLLHKSQSGFRKHHSCNTALLNLLDKWLNSIDKGELAIFFDLRKAFDVVDHELLLKKLSVYKFSNTSLNWIKSYLINRKQCVIDHKLRSPMQNVQAGVPQGSVLGPVLFLLFVNDLPLFINETYLELYADDATVHYADKNKNVVQTKLQNGTDGFFSWCQSNNTFIHFQKTSAMWVGVWQTLQGLDALDIQLANDSIQQVDTQKLLGIVIDKSLNWDDQINTVCLNITRKITLLKQLSKYIDKNNMKLYYTSYILPIFDYCCIIWSRTSALNTNRLLKLQKRAARIILGADIMTSSKHMFKELQWLSFPQRVNYHTCVLVYKSINGLAPEYLSQLFTKTSELHTRNLRSVNNDELRVPFARTNYFAKSFSVGTITTS